MKNRFTLILTLFLVAIMTSCGNNETKVEKTPEVLKEEARKAIEKERDRLLNASGPLDPILADNMINLYMDFVKNNPGDPEAQEYLFQAGSICMSKGDYKRSLRLFENSIHNYPDGPRSPDSYFMSGFVNQNYLNRLGAAEEAYKKVIEYYPRHELALQARATLETINLTDEELIERFEKINDVKN